MFIFLAKDNYQPSNILLEATEECWSTCFTTQELNEITESASLEILSNETVHDYEQTHTPTDKWPPVNWFPGWTRGSNTFHDPSFQPPIEARWIVMRKRKQIEN